MTRNDLLLLLLEKSVDGYVRLEDFTYNTHIYAAGYERPLKKSSLAQALKRLRIKGYVDVKKFENQVILKLTESGQKQAVLNRILKNEEWDGKWRIVIFDIPEELKSMRDAFRSRLKLWQFEKWQLSVWATKKDLALPLREFIKEVGIEKYARVIEAINV